MASRLRLSARAQDPDTSSSIFGAAVKPTEEEAGLVKRPETPRREVTDLGGASEVVYIPRFAPRETAWDWFDCLDKTIPWTRPDIRVFGRTAVQPRDMCYIADKGLTDLKYSGYQPHAHSWDEFPVLKDILKAVQEALPGSYFNSLLLNRYKNGSDYVSWHADDEPLYGPAPEIASLSVGCEREFLLRKKPTKSKVNIFQLLLDLEKVLESGLGSLLNNSNTLFYSSTDHCL